MNHFIQVSFVILAAILCAVLSACQSPPSGRVVDSVTLEAALSATLLLDESNIYFEDRAYLTVTQEELWEAINTSWQPHKPEAADCDDQAADILYALRRSFRNRGYAPAAGHVTGIIRGTLHCAVWYVNGDGKIRFIDPTSLAPLHPILIEPERAFDK